MKKEEMNESYYEHPEMRPGQPNYLAYAIFLIIIVTALFMLGVWLAWPL